MPQETWEAGLGPEKVALGGVVLEEQSGRYHGKSTGLPGTFSYEQKLFSFWGENSQS